MFDDNDEYEYIPTPKERELLEYWRIERRNDHLRALCDAQRLHTYSQRKEPRMKQYAVTDATRCVEFRDGRIITPRDDTRICETWEYAFAHRNLRQAQNPFGRYIVFSFTDDLP